MLDVAPSVRQGRVRQGFSLAFSSPALLGPSLPQVGFGLPLSVCARVRVNHHRGMTQQQALGRAFLSSRPQLGLPVSRLEVWKTRGNPSFLIAKRAASTSTAVMHNIPGNLVSCYTRDQELHHGASMSTGCRPAAGTGRPFGAHGPPPCCLLPLWRLQTRRAAVALAIMLATGMRPRTNEMGVILLTALEAADELLSSR